MACLLLRSESFSKEVNNINFSKKLYTQNSKQFNKKKFLSKQDLQEINFTIFKDVFKKNYFFFVFVFILYFLQNYLNNWISIEIRHVSFKDDRAEFINEFIRFILPLLFVIEIKFFQEVLIFYMQKRTSLSSSIIYSYIYGLQLESVENNVDRINYAITNFNRTIAERVLCILETSAFFVALPFIINNIKQEVDQKNFKIFIIVSLISVFGSLIPFFILNKKRTSTKEEFKNTDDFATRVLDSINNFQTIKLFSLEEREMKNNEKNEENMLNNQLSLKWKSIKPGMIGVGFVLFVLFFSILFFGKCIPNELIVLLNGLKTVMSFVIFVAWFFKANNESKEIIGDLSNLKEDMLLFSKEEISGINSIELKDFKIPLNNNRFIEGDFFIKGNQIIAVVGGSGSGKTTLVQNIIGFKQNENRKGKILINGIPMETINQKSLYSYVGYTSQSALFFDRTLDENFYFIVENKNSRYDKYDVFAKKVSMFDRIYINKELSENVYNQQVGFRGKNFSGGELQRLSLMRMLLNEKISLIIVDEPTSALDAISSSRINELIINLFKDRKIIFWIDHSKIIAKKYADKVLFIDQYGKIHFDSHLNLMENNLEYRDLFQEEVLKNES